jgi:predicted Fe-Mo cluster-binding NifX family protein
MGLAPRGKENKRKIAICSFKNRICPRFDLTGEMLIFDGNNAQSGLIGRFDVSRVSPEEMLHILAEKEVGVVITGGIQKRFQGMLHHSNIEVIWGVAGEVGEVLEAYMKGALRPGVGPLSAPKPLR